jgi:hypothetical protein
MGCLILVILGLKDCSRLGLRLGAGTSDKVLKIAEDKGKKFPIVPFF